MQNLGNSSYSTSSLRIRNPSGSLLHWAALIFVTAGIWLFFFSKVAAHQIESVEDLIASLNDRSFLVREQAMANLIRRGDEALGPLAVNSLASCPEIAWRTRRIIEQIGLLGNESVFIKCAAIIRTVNEGDRVETELDALRKSWKSNVSGRALDRLRQAGAEINVPEAGEVGLAMMAPFDFVEVDEQVSTVKTQERSIPPSREDKLERIETILKNDLATNYPIAYPVAISADDQTELATQQKLLRMQLRRQVNGLMLNQDPWTSWVKLGKQWHGTVEDFAVMSTVDGINEVHFADIEVTGDLIACLRNATNIDTIRFSNVAFSQNVGEELARLLAISTLEIRGDCGGDPAWFTGVEKLPNLNYLIVKGDSKNEKFVARFPKIRNLSRIDLGNMQITQSHFEVFANVPSLYALSLDGCQFSIPNYKSFIAQHPSIEVDFVPRAYMGVKTALDANMSPSWPWCKIGEVMPDTGAAEAGMLPGDVVKRIEGQDIETFDDLRLMVSQFQPNDVVNVDVERGETIIPMKIKLGDRQLVDQ